MSITGNSVHLGWQDQPDGRGTWDILKSCGGTIILLCWSSVCPNVSSLQNRGFRHSRQKFYLFLLAILGPDFIFMTALGQLQAAKNAQRKFKAAGHGEWSLRQCFFVNMGGFHVRSSDWSTSGKPSFPVNADQVIFLVEHGFLDLPSITNDEINDRNKADGFARTITIVQVIWFTAETLSRVGQGLAITTLELTTLAFIFLMSATAICWWRKPMDITAPVILDLKTNLKTVLDKAETTSNPPHKVYLGTPLASIGREEWFLSRHWYYYTEILRKLRLAPTSATPYELDHFQSIEYYPVSPKLELVACPLILLYGAIFMAAWNFHFPTAIEQTLWRIAAITCLVYNTVGEGVAGLDLHWKAVSNLLWRMFKNGDTQRNTENTDKSRDSRFTEFLSRLDATFEPLRNISPDADPARRIPLVTLIPTTVLCFLYAFSRAYILVADLISLRQLPTSAYETVDWGQYAPVF